jgi:hypothetical protein
VRLVGTSLVVAERWWSMVIRKNEFPLTYKWRGLLQKFSFEEHLPIIDCLQEAYITEWEVNQKDYVASYRENYFKKVLYRKLIGLVVLRNRNNDLFVDYDFSPSVPKDKGDLDDTVELNLLIKIRPFDEIFYEELIAHVAAMLRDIDVVASEMFLLRVRMNYKWGRLKELYYSSMAHNQYCNRVKMIKRLVKQEIVNDGKAVSNLN